MQNWDPIYEQYSHMLEASHEAMPEFKNLTFLTSGLIPGVTTVCLESLSYE